MEKSDRRNFIRTIAGAGIIAASAPVFGLPKRATSGMEEIRRARGNQTSTLPMIDACCPATLDLKGLETFANATATYGVQANLFIPQAAKRNLAGVSREDMLALNEMTAKIAEKSQNAKFAGVISLGQISEALAEIDKCAKVYKLSALAMSTSGPLHNYLGSKDSIPVLQKAAEYGLPIIINGMSLPLTDSVSDNDDIGAAVDQILALDHIPENLRIVLPNFGGSYTWHKAVKGETAPQDHPFYFYAGQRISTDAFRCFKNVFGSDRMLLGSAGNMNYREVLKNVEDLSLSSNEFRKTCYQNANTLFGFDVKE